MCFTPRSPKCSSVRRITDSTKKTWLMPVPAKALASHSAPFICPDSAIPFLLSAAALAFLFRDNRRRVAETRFLVTAAPRRLFARARRKEIRPKPLESLDSPSEKQVGTGRNRWMGPKFCRFPQAYRVRGVHQRRYMFLLCSVKRRPFQSPLSPRKRLLLDRT